MSGGRNWTPAEDAVLKRRWREEGNRCAASLPGRSVAACEARANRLGLKVAARRRWTWREDAVVRAHYPAMGGGALEASGLLPGRGAQEIRNRANRLGLRRDGSPGDWGGEVEPYVPRAPWTPACERLARATWARTLGKADGCRELAATRAANLLDVPYEAFAARLAELDGRWAA